MFIFNRISSQEKVDFTKNLAIMLKSGIAINEALASLADQTKSKTFSRVIYKVKSKLEMGTSLSESFAKEEKTFGNVFISLLKAGEASGTLEGSLSFLADWLERNHDLQQEIKAATLYPKFVLSATCLLGGGLAVYILPKLVPLFDQLRVELPLATRILLAFSLFVEKYWFLVLLGIIGVMIAFILLNRLKRVKRFFHLIYIGMPFVSGLMIDYQLALISQLFSTLFKSGLSISESLSITSEAATNILYQESIEKIKNRVATGTTLSQAMQGYPKLYPKNMINIVAVGEKSGTLENSFIYLSEFYSKEVKNKTKKLPTIIEPVLLVFIAIMVGFVALSIIMPIYELTSGISM
ncbi:MAG: type II secretion system F family protein [Minisyncoccales bacterium]